jgi:uncharacterized protein (TIGR03000 family)
VPFGYSDSAPYSVPYSSDVNIENSSNDGPNDDGDDDGDDSDGEDEDSGNDDDDQGDQSQEGETATGAATTPNRGALHVKLPTNNATVLFDGEKMMGFGKERWILTPKMATGESTKFQIQAVWTENGKDVKEVREGRVTAGQKVDVDFTTPETNAKTVSTLTDGLKAFVMPLLHSRIGNTMVN